jgi:hypothetical protein
MLNSAIIETLGQTWGILVMSINANQLSLRLFVKDIARSTLRTLLIARSKKLQEKPLVRSKMLTTRQFWIYTITKKVFVKFMKLGLLVAMH